MTTIAHLQAENVRLRALLEEREQDIVERDQQIALLNARIDWLNQKLFGSGQSEKIDRAQLLLDLEEVKNELSALQNAPVQKFEVERRIKPRVAQSPQEHFKDLPVHETVVIVPEEVKKNPDLYEQIDEERTFEVDVIAPKLVKREIVRPRYRFKLDRNHPPVVAAAPVRVVEGGYASAGLLAWVVVCKYLDHLPLYRLEKMTERWGARLSRQSMADWVEVASFWLKPIYDRMRKDLIAGPYVQADETPVNYLDPDSKQKKALKGQLWVMGIPRGPVVFDWHLNRGHAGARHLLRGFKGLLQADGYQAYDRLGKLDADVVRLGCLAHVRRKWFESLSTHKREAALALRIFARIYAREQEYRELQLSAGQRTERRQKELTVLFQRLHTLAVICRQKVLPKSNLGKAADYTLNQWTSIKLLLQHGEAELDNNLIENAIRPSAIGKKNWLFIGSPEAGGRTAIIYSIVVTCQRFGVNTHDYLRDVLSTLPKLSNQDDLTHLLPQNWGKQSR
ncbi:MAG: IS66 family transposase [Verrucomicrobia bacterium]|nr:IS66 family transposase [Verrucomicrobiota bacterium]